MPKSSLSQGLELEGADRVGRQLGFHLKAKVSGTGDDLALS